MSHGGNEEGRSQGGGNGSKDRGGDQDSEAGGGDRDPHTLAELETGSPVVDRSTQMMVTEGKLSD